MCHKRSSREVFPVIRSMYGVRLHFFLAHSLILRYSEFADQLFEKLIQYDTLTATIVNLGGSQL